MPLFILHKKMNKMLSLPPTCNMLYRHILRSCYVVLITLDLILAPDTNLNPVEFSWNSVDSVLLSNKYIVILPEMYTVTCGCNKKCTGRFSAASLTFHGNNFLVATENLVLSLPIESVRLCIS